MLQALCDALEPPDVAAATIAGCGQTLTVLGVPALPIAPARPAPTLYASEGLVVFHRARVLGTGGVDASLVFGHELANLGWRLALRGFRTVEVGGISPKWPVRLKPDTTTVTPRPDATLDTPKSETPTRETTADGPDRRGRATRLRHQTANGLATLFVCAGDDWLHSALPAALAREMCLAAVDAGLAPGQFDFGRHIPAKLPLPIESVARLLAIDDLIRHFPALRQRRAREQAARKRSDEEIRALFAGDPVDEAWLDAAGDNAQVLCRMLGVGKQGVTFAPAGHHGPTDSERPFAKGNSSADPPVSIIVLTASGPKHLPDCLDSLAALDYPRDAVEVIVVDNGSLEDSAATVEQHYPGARLIRSDRNLGFCGGNNLGTAAASHEWLFFLNDDTRVDRRLLRAAFDTATRHRAACVGAFVLDWSGRHVDYAGGGVNFEAHGFQHGVESSQPDRWKRERTVAFANGAATLVRRDAYLAAGGFPNAYFAYYEDVALGWALWLLGHQVWLSPDAIVYHRHHGTSVRSANAARQRNCERNACFTLLTHASDALLPDLLTASLLLAAERVTMSIGLGGIIDDRIAFNDDHRLAASARLDPRLYIRQLRAELLRRGARREHGVFGSLSRVGLSGVLDAFGSLYRLARWGGTPAPAVTDLVETPSDGVATLAAVAEWCQRIGEMEPRRRAMQQTRSAGDDEVLARLAENWLDVIPVEPARQAEYERAHRAVVKQFDLERLIRGA